MKMTEDDAKRFPKFAKYIRMEMPKLAGDRNIVDTMNDLVGIEKSKVKSALRWGNAPSIKIVLDLVCTTRASGCFRNVQPNQIEIEERVVEDFETGRADEPLSTGTNKVPRAGIVLLHELVHWADYRVDKQHTSVRDPYHDVGSKWEWLVFATFLPEMQGG